MSAVTMVERTPGAVVDTFLSFAGENGFRYGILGTWYESHEAGYRDCAADSAAGHPGRQEFERQWS